MLIIFLIINAINRKEGKEYIEVNDYKNIAILVNGSPAANVPADNYYYMSTTCSGIKLNWDVVEKKLRMKASDLPASISSCTVNFEEVSMDIKVDNVTNNNPTGDLFVVSQNCSDAEISFDDKLNIKFNSKPTLCGINLITLKGNAPVLFDGMIPVKWSGTTLVKSSVSDTEWYDYNNKKWANAVIVSNNRATYLSAAVGTTITESDVIGYYVWIPRFIYKISSNWHSNTLGTIDVKFSYETNDNVKSGVVTTQSSNASNGTWSDHPAFTFGINQLTGIWVSKFEVSAYTRSVPNSTSTKSLVINDAYAYSRGIGADSDTGWTLGQLNSHLMKNTEWGAAAYLAMSKYGKNSEISANTSSSYYTGGGTSGAFKTNVTQSTTGNIYGVYDMVGGANEFVSAYLNNGNAVLTTNAYGLLNANSMYKNIYSVGSSDTAENNYVPAINSKGDALYETSNSHTGTASWLSNTSSYVVTATPIFTRGGSYNTSYGLFSFIPQSGASSASTGYRNVLVSSIGPNVSFAGDKITVTSSIGVDASSLKYIIGSACSGFDMRAPLESSFFTSFANGASFPNPPGGMGRLWVLAKDTQGNTTIVLGPYYGGACGA